MQTPTTVTPRLGPALLREIPRFFSGFPAAIQELLQNSLRANATDIHFTLSGQTLTIADNGVGLDDPQILMTAAQSGWSDTVIEPAGLGALSVLNPAFSAAVTYRSRDWQFTLTPDAFQNAEPTPVEAAQFIPGFQVTLHLREPLTEPAFLATLTARRGYAPARVSLNGQDVPPTAPTGTRVETPIGPVYLARRTYGAALPATAVWEHFPLSAQALLTRLREVSTPLVKAAVSRYDLLILLDPACGVRPKLPDRNDLLDDDALRAAATALAATLHDHFNAALSAMIPTLGAPFIPEAEHRAATHSYDFATLAAFRQLHGYLPSTLSRAGDFWYDYAYDSEDDSRGDMSRDWVASTQPLLRTLYTTENALLNLLRAHQPNAGWPYGSSEASGDPITVTVGTVRPVITRQDGLVGLTDHLTVQGRPVPAAVHVIAGADTEDAQQYALVLRGTPEEAEDFLRAHLADVGGLLMMALDDHCEVRDAELTDEDDTLYAADVGAMILHDLIDTFFPERAQAQQEVERLRTVNGRLTTALSALKGITPLDAPLGDLFAGPVTTIQATISTHETRITELTAEHQLAAQPSAPPQAA